MYRYIYTYIHICVICITIHVYVYAYTCIYIYTYTYLYTLKYKHTHMHHTRTHARACKHIRTHTHTYTHAHLLGNLSERPHLSTHTQASTRHLAPRQLTVEYITHTILGLFTHHMIRQLFYRDLFFFLMLVVLNPKKFVTDVLMYVCVCPRSSLFEMYMLCGVCACVCVYVCVRVCLRKKTGEESVEK